MHATGSPSDPEPRPRVWRAPGFPALLVMTVLGFAGYAALLPLGPLWAVHGGAGPAGAGLVNGVMLGVTVVSQLAVPGALRRFGWGPVMAVGLLLLGLPSLPHLLVDGLGGILALAAVRGVGFAVLSVTGSSAAAHLVHPSRRGAAVGAYGLAVGLPNLAFMPWGPTVVEELGWLPVFATGALPVLGAPAALAAARHLPPEDRHVPPDEPGPTGSAGRTPYLRLAAPSLVLLAVTFAGGAVISFAPQLTAQPWQATLGLLALGATAALTRWGVGGLADRIGAGTLVWPATLVATLSMLGLAMLLGLDPWRPVDHHPLPWMLVMGALGIAYGGLQNLTYVVCLDRVPAERISSASAVWNAGFDTGTAVGATLVGAIASAAGFGWGMVAAAVVCALSLPLAWRVRR